MPHDTHFTIIPKRKDIGAFVTCLKIPCLSDVYAEFCDTFACRKWPAAPSQNPCPSPPRYPARDEYGSFTLRLAGLDQRDECRCPSCTSLAADRTDR